MVRAATRILIEEAHRYSAIYRGGFANHLPMALVALDAMGADEGRMQRFIASYARQLEPMRAADREIRRGEEERSLGVAAAFPAWVDYFEGRIAREGIEAVAREFSSTLAAGIGTAAFHGAIRTAYALESGSPRELAHGLAYWAAVLERLPEVAAPRGSQSPLEVFGALARDPLLAGKRPPGNGISARMASVMRQPAFDSWVARLDPRSLDIDVLATALIRAYCATGDFTLLHGVTGCQAFRVLIPVIADPVAATRSLWTAIVAAYASCGSPDPAGWRLEGRDDLDWSAIHGGARECDDEHDVKFAYSCWREWQRSGDELYRRAASARVCHALEHAAAG